MSKSSLNVARPDGDQMQAGDSCRLGSGNKAVRSTVLVSAVLILLVVAVYWPVCNYEFVQIDDWAYVTANPAIQRGLSWDNFLWAFQNEYSGNWHPVTSLSHMLDCQLYGLEAGGHHFSSLLIHAANAALLFLLLKRITGALWPSATVAALFALHPLRVESVAWISERKDVLSGFFFLLTIWVYVSYARTRRNGATPSNAAGVREVQSLPYWAYILALLLFAIGLMCKPMLVTLPCVLLLLDFWLLQRTFSARLIVEKIPFFILSVVSSIITFHAQKSGGAVVSLQKLPFVERLVHVLMAYGRYVMKTFVPHPLAVFYPYRGVPSVWLILFVALMLGAVSIAAFAVAKSKPALFTGWFWFVGMLVPASGLIQVGSQAMADRYTYLPSIGLFIALIWGVSEVAARFLRSSLWVRAAAAFVIAGCMIVTGLQLGYWKNSELLFDHAIRVTKGNSQAHYCLGVLVENQGREAEALDHYLKAVQIAPDFFEAHTSLANLLVKEKKFADARKEFVTALRYQTNYADAHYGLAQLALKERNTQEAKTQYAAAIVARPDFAEAHYQLATILEGESDVRTAIEHYRVAIRWNPEWLEALNNLAWILATHPDEKLRNGKEAVALAERAVKLTRKRQPAALDTLAAAYAEAGRFSEAVATAQDASKLAAAAKAKDLTTDLENRLAAYRAGMPYRDRPHPSQNGGKAE